MTRRPLIALIAVMFAALVATPACSPGGGESGPADPGEAAGDSVGADEPRAALAAFGLDAQGRVSWESRSQDGAAFTFETVTMSDDESAFTAARLVLAEPRLTPDGPVFQRFEVSDGSMNAADGLRTEVDRLTIVDAGPDLGAALAAALRGDADGEADGEGPAGGGTWRFAEMSVEGLTVSGVNETGRPLELTLSAGSASGADGESIEAVRLDQLSFASTDAQGAPVSVALAALSVDGLAAELAGLSQGGPAAPAAPLAGALTPNTQYERFSLSDLEVRASGLRAVMPGLSGVVEAVGESRMISRTNMERLSITADPEAGDQGRRFAQALDQLGYEAMDFSMANAVAYDLEADRVQTIEQNYLRLENGFTLRFEQAARGARAYAEAYEAWLEQAGGEGSAAPPAEVFEPLRIERMVISLEDQSLLDRSLGVLAEMQGVTPEQLRMQAGAYVALGAAFAGEVIPPRMLTELQAALTGFVGQGGTLTATLAPPEPVSMATLMNGGADAEAMGLTVTHESP